MKGINTKKKEVLKNKTHKKNNLSFKKMEKSLLPDNIMTPSQVSNTLQSLITGSNIRRVNVKGEITNLSNRQNNLYFGIKDNLGGILNCVMWNSNARQKSIEDAKDGTNVIISGNIKLYAKWGKYQCYVDNLELMNDEGEWNKQYTKWKIQLEKEGCFLEERKKCIAEYIQKIAIITSKDGAALQDILDIFKKSNSPLDITIFPCNSQGVNCVKTICNQLDKIHNGLMFDVVLITRGGGSREDLWEYNNPELIRNVNTFQNEGGPPIISAIGHQIDESLLDLVSDLSCITPSAAAQYIIEPYVSLKNTLEHQHSSIQKNINSFLQSIQNKFISIENNISQYSPHTKLLQKINQDYYKIKFNIKQYLQKENSRWTNIYTQICKDKRYQWQNIPNLALIQDENGNPIEKTYFDEKKSRGTIFLVLPNKKIKLHYRVGV